MTEQSSVKKHWALLVSLYVVATFFGGVLTSFPSSAGKMFVPILIGAGLLRWASSHNSVRNIYIGVVLFLIYFLLQDYSETRSNVISAISDECLNNNASVASTVTSDQQKTEYCGCAAEEMANFVIWRAAQERFSSDDGVSTADEFAADIDFKARLASAQQICSARIAS